MSLSPKLAKVLIKPNVFVALVLAVVVGAAGWMVPSRAGTGLGLAVTTVGLILIFTFNREKLPVVAICFAVLSLLFVPPKAIGPGLIGLFLAPVLSALLISFSIKRSGRPVHKPRGFHVLLAMYGVLLLTSTVNSGTDFYYLAVGVVGVAIFLGSAQLDLAEILTVRRVIVLAASMSAILALVENRIVGGAIVGSYSASLGSNTLIEGVRAQATLGHPLVLGFVLVTGMISLVSGLSLRWPVVVAGVVLMFAGVLATGSASAVVVALVAISASLVLKAGRGARRAYVGAAVVVVGMVILQSRLLPSTLFIGVEGKLTGVNTEHRTASLEAIPDLLVDQSVPRVLFGNGWGSARELYREGLLKSDGFYAVDNQIVTYLVTGGVISVFLFLSFLLIRLKETDATGAVTVISAVVMGFSFDIFEWAAPVGVMMVLLSVTGSPIRRTLTAGKGQSERSPVSF